jgi:acetolactate synthase-1/2/3 large subunit
MTARFERLADDILASGVRMAFGIPGSGATLSLIDALEKRGIPFHLTHFEGSGVLMAATGGRLSGRAGVSLSIKGPGLANAVPGLAASWLEAYPVVHFAEAFPPGSQASQAHKRLDQAALCAPITKGARYVPLAGEGFPQVAAWAEEEEPGPVLFELAERAPETFALAAPGPAARSLSARVHEMVRRSSRPVVIAGTLAVRRGWSAALARLRVPVFSTAAAKGVVDETLPHSAGVYTGVGLSLTPEQRLLPDADLVVGLGLTAREVLSAKPFACPAVNIEAVDSPGVDGFAFAERTCVAGFAETIDALSNKSWGSERLSEVLTALDSRMAEGFLPGSVFASIERCFAGRARIVLDTGYFCTIGEHAVRARNAALCLLSGQGRYMGTGLPMAIGASLHDRSLPTIAVLGDGGIGMYLADIKLAVRHKLPLLVLLMTDNAFGSLRSRAIREGLTQKPLIMDSVSWVEVLEALGTPGTRADSSKAVDAALKVWDPSSGPAFLEVPFAADPYERMVADIR